MIRKIFLVHHTHMDIGYTDQPPEVLDQHLRFLDAAVELGNRDPEFCWTIESAYLVKDYQRNRDAKRVDALFELLRRRQFELSAFEVQPLTELMTRTELTESVDFAVRLGREAGFPVEQAMLDDIGGFAVRLPSALAARGIRFLTSGVGSFQAFLPWARLPHLLYLEDCSGHRVLVWNLGIDRTSSPKESVGATAVYGMGTAFVIQPYLRRFPDLPGAPGGVAAPSGMVEPSDAPFRRLVARLEREHYPYEEIMLQCGGDNRWPSDFLPGLLRRINAERELPPVELTTPSRFFHHMVDKYGAAIAVCRGVVTDPWATRINPAPEGLKYYLAAQRRREYIENLGGSPTESLKEHLSLYADHTCGLSEWHAPELATRSNPDDPVFENLRSSWRAKRRYAEAADMESAAVLRRLVNRRALSLVTLFNLSGVDQAGVAELRIGRDLPELEALFLPDGTPLNWQVIDHQRYWVEVPFVAAGEEIPLTPRFGPVPEYHDKSPEAARPLPPVLETECFRCDLDVGSGRIRRLGSRDGKTLYSDGSLFELKLQIPEDYQLDHAEAGMRPLRRSRFPLPEITGCGLLHSGAVGWCWEQRGGWGDRLRYRLKFSLYRHFPFLDVECFLDKPAHRELEGVYLACGLAGTAEKWEIGQHGGEVDPARDLLPGAMRDLFYAPRGARLETANFTAMMRGFDAPVLHPGHPALFAWDPNRGFDSEPACFYWNIYQNMLVSDCPAWQSILGTFHFRLYLPAPDGYPPAPDSLCIQG